jgi:hypothetical protein
MPISSSSRVKTAVTQSPPVSGVNVHCVLGVPDAQSSRLQRTNEVVGSG